MDRSIDKTGGISVFYTKETRYNYGKTRELNHIHQSELRKEKFHTAI